MMGGALIALHPSYLLVKQLQRSSDYFLAFRKPPKKADQ